MDVISKIESEGLAALPSLDKLKAVENPSQKEIYYTQLPLPEVPTAPPAIGPDNPPWNSPVAFAVWLLSVLFIIFIPNLFVLPYIRNQQIPLGDSTRLVQFLQSDPTAVLLSLGAIIPAHLLTFVVAWAVITRFRRFPFFKTIGWDWGGMRWWHFAAILIGFFALALILSEVMPEQENDLLRILRSSRVAVYLMAFLATFTAPFVEELIYRGVLYSAFQRTFGTVAGVISVTLLFSLVHVPQYYPSWVTIILLTLLSLILTVVRAKTGNLLPCIALHFLFNGIQSVGLLLGQGTDQVNPAVPGADAFFFHLIK
jgi:membrane protease YdiL (CAAX protease family)